MIMVVGLGNPGKEYEKTRHNIGWRVVDELAKSDEIVSGGSRGVVLKPDKKLKADLAMGNVHGNKVLLVKPTTFMNLSGEAVKAVADYYKIEKKNIWVVGDDLDLPVGFMRARKEGSSGGQKGLQSILDKIGTAEIARVRLGIGPMTQEGGVEKSDKRLDAEIYVLQEFNKREKAVVNKVIKRAVEMIIDGIGKRQLDSDTISVL